VLSFNGGYVDTMGYLALQGLFTAHVTGNFVTIGAALVFGTAGVIAKLLALPVFCAVIVLTRLASIPLASRQRPVLPTLLAVQVLLLAGAGLLAVMHGPFTQGDGWPAILAGMTLVAAMAIQNAAQRVHLSTAPPSTLMTGTTTQLMIDLADMVRGVPAASRDATLARMRGMSLAIVTFACGAAGAALFFAKASTWCFIVPPVVAAIARSMAAGTGISAVEGAAHGGSSGRVAGG
jgi:uncharacterized membrane protein YoaK (UPF0700 family)